MRAMINVATKKARLSRAIVVVPRAGFEPATLGLEVLCSIQLSYQGMGNVLIMVRVERIELSSRVWKTRILADELYPHATFALNSIPEVGYTTHMQLTLITGNQHKLEEWERQLPSHIKLQHQAIDLDEIQSLDSAEIIRHKVRQAYAITQMPVVVEDVSAGLDNLNGLPGPFVKFFIERIGKDALYQIGGEGAAMTVACTIGYYDGTNEIIVDGTLRGTATAARGDAFGFDVSFVPDGQSKTYSEMTAAEKDAVSHRHIAIGNLVAELSKLA